MALVGKDEFDSDLQAFKDDVNTLIAAILAFIALPPVIDLTNEDATVKAGKADVDAALAQIPQPPPPVP